MRHAHAIERRLPEAEALAPRLGFTRQQIRSQIGRQRRLKR